MAKQPTVQFRPEISVQLKAAIGAFLIEFSKFETQSVGTVLRSLSKDAVFVEQAERLLDLEARLKLVERMAFARGVTPTLMAEIEALLLRARKLQDIRHDVARSLAAVDFETGKRALNAPPSMVKELKPRKADYAQLAQAANLVPALAEILRDTAEAVALQESVLAISEKLDRHITALAMALPA